MTDSPSPVLHLELDIEPRSEPIVGVLTDPSGRRLPFSGWTGLAAALGRLTGASTDSDPPEVSP